MEQEITMEQINTAWQNYVNSHISHPPTKSGNFLLDLPTISPLKLTKTAFIIHCHKDHSFLTKYLSPHNIN